MEGAAHYQSLDINASALDVGTQLHLPLDDEPVRARHARIWFDPSSVGAGVNMWLDFDYDVDGTYLSNDATLAGGWSQVVGVVVLPLE